MSALVFGILYVCAGMVVAILLKRRGAGSRDWAVSIIIWPITLPSALALDSEQSGSSTDPLQAAANAVEAAWGEGHFGDSRELGAVRAFVTKLNATRHQITEMNQLLRTTKLPVGEKLVTVKVLREQELAEGVRLLDELTGQLVLLRFARGAESANTDRRRIEEVLARIESLAHLTSSDAGAAAVDNPASKC